MPRMMVASSPVEIEAKAEEAGLPVAAHYIARRMFHDLTDRLGQAAIALALPYRDWPSHRFYFGTAGTEMSALIDGLRSRVDIVDVTDGAPDRPPSLTGLYVQDMHEMFVGVLVGHADHHGMRASGGPSQL